MSRTDGGILLALVFTSACFAESHEVFPVFLSDGGFVDAASDGGAPRDGAIADGATDGGALEGGVGVDGGGSDGSVADASFGDAGFDAAVSDGGAGDAGFGAACRNVSDARGLLRSDYGPERNLTYSEVLGICGFSCAAALDGNACIGACIDDFIDGAVSSTCNGCFVGFVGCVTDLCFLPCLFDPVACLACQCGDNLVGRNCADEAASCAGIPSSCDG